MGKFIDLTNQKFGSLTVLYFIGKIPNRSKNANYWHCKCDCGNECDINGASLRSGNTKSCGCQKFKGLQAYNQEQSELNIIPLNTKFGKLTVIKDLGLIEASKHKRRGYLCKCECGNETVVIGNTLKTGGKISCGKCITSKGEYIIQKLLDENNIKYNHDIICKGILQEYNRPLRFDFEILNNDGSLNRYIEFDGKQHYYGPDTNYWGHSSDTLQTIQEKDNIKNEYCLKHNITLVRIPYYYYSSLTINDLLGNKFILNIKGE